VQFESFTFHDFAAIDSPIGNVDRGFHFGSSIPVQETLFRINFMIRNCFAIASAEALDADSTLADFVELTICLAEDRHGRAEHLVRKSEIDADRLGHYIAANKLKNLFATSPDIVACLPEPIPDRLHKHVNQQRNRQQKYISELASVTNLLEEAGIRVMALKGPSLGQRLFGDPLKRFFGDLDALVDPDQIADAITVLQSRGYSLAKGLSRLSDHRLRTNHAVELRYDTIRIDLHWHFRNVPYYRIDMSKVWLERRTIEIAGNPVRIASDEHTVVLLCLSVIDDLSMGKLRIKHMLDLYLMLQVFDPNYDWEHFFAERVADNTLSVVLNAIAILEGISPSGLLPLKLREEMQRHEDLIVTRNPATCAQLVIQERKSFLTWLWLIQVYPSSSFRDLIDFWRFQLPHIGSAPRAAWRGGLRVYQTTRFLCHYRRLAKLLGQKRNR